MKKPRAGSQARALGWRLTILSASQPAKKVPNAAAAPSTTPVSCEA